MKKILILFILGCLVIAGCSSANVSVQPAESMTGSTAESRDDHEESHASQDGSDTSQPEEYVYMAFGDSIARGYGLAVPGEEAYPSLLAGYIPDSILFNYAVDGHKSNNLLGILDGVENLAKADLVTISIGANNILGYATEALTSIIIRHGESIFAEYLKILTGEGDSEKITGFIDEMRNELESDEFKEKMQNGYKDLENDLPVIISKIREKNSSCIIVVSTIYNPYKGLNFSVPSLVSFDLSGISADYIKPLNEIILSGAGSMGYMVADVAMAFDSSSESLVNAGFDIINSQFSVDPHPTRAGHLKIAEVHKILLGY